MLWFNAPGSQKRGVGMVIGFLSTAFENRLLKSLKRKSLQKRSGEELHRRLSTYKIRIMEGTMETGVSAVEI